MSAAAPTEHEITGGGYRAVVTEAGGALRVLEHHGVPLVRSWPAGTPAPVHGGAVLAPWPNRVRDGRWVHDGVVQQLELSEPERGTALHGLVEHVRWSPTRRAQDEVVLTTRIVGRPGYPATVDLELRYTLDDAGLTTELTATGAGPGPAPYGCGVHPWFVAPTGTVDTWSVQLAADEVQPVDPVRLLPDGPTVPVTGELDLREGPTLGPRRLDHAWTGLGSGTARVRGPDGRGVRIDWDPATLPWVQVCTGERPEPDLDRTGLALEPMTCPPDALSSGTGLVHLAAGEHHTAWWRYAALPPASSHHENGHP